MLLLSQEDAATVAMVRHSLDVIKKVTEVTNPGQAPVIEVDQPLFAIAKYIQWRWTTVYGETKSVIMFGGLHIELAASSTCTGRSWNSRHSCLNVESKSRDMLTRWQLMSCTKPWKIHLEST